MASTATRISLNGWIIVIAVVLTVASVIGMIYVDQLNRASINECNKRSSAVHRPWIRSLLKWKQMHSSSVQYLMVNLHRNQKLAQKLPTEFYKLGPFHSSTGKEGNYYPFPLKSTDDFLFPKRDQSTEIIVCLN